MKIFRSITLTLITFLSINSTYAQDLAGSTSAVNPDFMVQFYPSPGTYKIRVYLAKTNTDKHPLILSVKDEHGKIVSTKRIYQKQIVLNYDLEELADGKYLFELQNKAQKITKVFSKETYNIFIKLNKQLYAIN